MMEKVKYTDLNSKQKESYNFQKISAVLADYGYTTILLADDWQGADFIAMHISGEKFLKVQLKGRLTFDKKYMEKDLYICFPLNDKWYLYPHDETIKNLESINSFTESDSWKINNGYSWGKPPKNVLDFLESYQI